MRANRPTLTGIVLLALLLAPSGVVATEADDANAGPDSAAVVLPYAAIGGSARGIRATKPDTELTATLPEVRATGYYALVDVTADDPRVSGRLEGTQNYHQFVEDGFGAVRAGTARLVNDGGSWAATFTGFTPPGAPDQLSANYYQVMLTGEEAYEGLSAIIVLRPDGTAVWEVEGVIFPGPMPDYPAPFEPSGE